MTRVFLLLFGTAALLLGGFFLLASFGWTGPDSVAIIGVAVGTIGLSAIFFGLARIVGLLETIAENTRPQTAIADPNGGGPGVRLRDATTAASGHDQGNG